MLSAENFREGAKHLNIDSWFLMNELTGLQLQKKIIFSFWKKKQKKNRINP